MESSFRDLYELRLVFLSSGIIAPLLSFRNVLCKDQCGQSDIDHIHSDGEYYIEWAENFKISIEWAENFKILNAHLF